MPLVIERLPTTCDINLKVQHRSDPVSFPSHSDKLWPEFVWCSLFRTRRSPLENDDPNDRSLSDTVEDNVWTKVYLILRETLYTCRQDKQSLPFERFQDSNIKRKGSLFWLSQIAYVLLCSQNRRCNLRMGQWEIELNCKLFLHLVSIVSNCVVQS